MKLANALADRAEIQKQIANLQTRLCNNAKVQDGEQPAEDPMALLAELDTLTAQYEELMRRINITNTLTVYEGMTMTAMLAHRDALRSKISIMQRFLREASDKTTRYSRSEILIKSTVDVKTLQTQVDVLSKELREVDQRIQELNWTTELQ